jgi:hypothetical protein
MPSEPWGAPRLPAQILTRRHPIEQVIVKFKRLLRKAKARTYERCHERKRSHPRYYPPEECAACVRNAEYA